MSVDWFKDNRALVAGLLLYVAVAGGGVLWLVRLHRQTRHDFAMLARKQHERDQLARLSPSPSVANERAIVAEIRSAGQALETLRTALQGRDADLLAVPPPATPIDACFEIAGMVERLRTLAGQRHVSLHADERFGFASYAKAGPAISLLPAVHRQRLVAQHLVETLLEAEPRELLRVQRERPAGAASRTDSLATPDGTSDVATDFFMPDERLSLRVAGLVGTGAFRVEFTGQTQVLRLFLNELAAFRLPLVVRSIEVEPLGAAVPDQGSRDSAPFVAATFSKFSVVVECIELLPTASAPSP